MELSVLDRFLFTSEFDKPTQPTKPKTALETLADIVQDSKDELAQLEIVIAACENSWYEAGKALTIITEKRLAYTSGYKSFADYCKRRWSRSTTWGYSLIYAAKAKEDIDPHISLPPNGYAYYKLLYTLGTTEDRVAVWEELTAGDEHPKIHELKVAINKHRGTTPKAKVTRSVQVPVELADLLEATAKEGVFQWVRW